MMPASANACGVRAMVARRHRVALRGARPPHRSQRPDRRPHHHGLRQHQVIKDLIAARLGRRVRSCSKPRLSALHDVDPPARAITLPRSWHAARARLRLDRRMRRLPRDLPRRRYRPTGCICTSATIPFAWLGILARGAARLGGTDLCRGTTRGFALLSACARRDFAPLSPMRRRTKTSARGRTSASGANCARRTERDDGWVLNEGRSCRRASPPMRSFVVEPMRHGAAVPCRRRRAYRAAHRRQGPEPRGRRRRACWRGRSPLSTASAARICWTAIPRPACVASGRCSASPGG